MIGICSKCKRALRFYNPRQEVKLCMNCYQMEHRDKKKCRERHRKWVEKNKEKNRKYMKKYNLKRKILCLFIKDKSL